MKTRSRLLATAALTAVLLAGCGDSDDSPGSAETATPDGRIVVPEVEIPADVLAAYPMAEEAYKLATDHALDMVGPLVATRRDELTAADLEDVWPLITADHRADLEASLDCAATDDTCWGNVTGSRLYGMPEYLETHQAPWRLRNDVDELAINKTIENPVLSLEPANGYLVVEFRYTFDLLVESPDGEERNWPIEADVRRLYEADDQGNLLCWGAEANYQPAEDLTAS